MSNPHSGEGERNGKDNAPTASSNRRRRRKSAVPETSVSTQTQAQPKPKPQQKPRSKPKAKAPPQPTVVPRILMRPSAAPSTPAAPVSPVKPTPPLTPVTPTSPREPHAHVHPLLPTPNPARPSLATRIANDTGRPTVIPLLSNTGKLLAATRRPPASGANDTCTLRTTVGVIGRAGVGKTYLVERLFRQVDKTSQASAAALDLCVLPGGVAYIDAPAVMSLNAADKWPRRSGSARRSWVRLRDLQLTVLLLLVCDRLVVVVGPGDQRMGRLVGRAMELKLAIPGVAPGRPCAVHLVVNRSKSSEDLTAAAETFTAAGVTLASVSVLPECENLPPTLSASEIAQRWAQEPCLPLFSMLPETDGHEHSLVGGYHSLDVLSFDERMDMLRERVLGQCGRAELEGVWLAMCVRAWDSIRRSDVLARAAAAKDDILDTMDA
ncbi:hypothetical protein LPJ73_001530 [Coemansia sp. RSA 2703]|nr:hypothetical protein LPJ73_001530 [Coemansia sp. RSA 2703]KAJ2379065.1 hypothetical protein IW150_000412 [Coemansia sp. RSA 2607]KAJ2396647.1 hypothetical protein GGI05_001024 [Coemansia sp. RSA 2603]